MQAQIRQLTARVCAVQNLKSRMKMLLLEHYRRSGKQKPQVLIWYRDGVSEGQFPECSRIEARLTSLTLHL